MARPPARGLPISAHFPVLLQGLERPSYRSGQWDLDGIEKSVSHDDLEVAEQGLPIGRRAFRLYAPSNLSPIFSQLSAVRGVDDRPDVRAESLTLRSKSDVPPTHMCGLSLVRTHITSDVIRSRLRRTQNAPTCGQCPS